MSGSVTVLDNTGDGTEGFSDNSSFITTSTVRGYSFTTSASSSWEISGIRLAFLSPGGATTWSVNIALYKRSGSLPTGGATASVSVSVALTGNMTYCSFDASALGGIATATMSASPASVAAAVGVCGKTSECAARGCSGCRGRRVFWF